MSQPRPTDPAVAAAVDLSAPVSGKSRSRWRALLLGWPAKVALSVGLIAYLASSLDWPRVTQALLATDKLRVATAFAVLGIIPLIVAERWRLACAALKVRLSFRFFVRAMYAALFAGQILPSGIGVDAVRLALLWQQQVPLRSSVPSLAIDRAAGVSAIIVLMFVGMPFALQLLPPGAAGPLAVITGLMAVGG